MSRAPEAIEAQIFIPGTGQDPAKYLVNPGSWDERSKSMTPGDLAHARPWLDSGNRVFVWPVPTEGFRRTGQSMLGLHHYIGDQYVDAQVIHRDEARIEMTGVFPGTSGQDNMVEFGNTLNDDPPDAGMVLNVPGVFDQVKFVVPENWEFSHDADDETHSISYTVTFVVIGDGRRLPDPSGTAPGNPGDFPGTPIDLGPLDPWQIRIGIGASEQPGNDFFFSPNFSGGSTGAGGGGGGGSDGGSGVVGGFVAPGGWGEAGSTYGQDVLAAASWAFVNSRGWTHPSGSDELELMQNGQVFHDGGGDYIFVKVGTPTGNSTEKVYLPPPGTPSTSNGVTPSAATTVTTTDKTNTLQDMAEAVTGAGLNWEDLYNKNQGLFDSMDVAKYEAPTARIPVGVPLFV